MVVELARLCEEDTESYLITTAGEAINTGWIL
jgi:hypothetical protein